MQISSFPIADLQITNRIITDYLASSPALRPFVHDFPSIESFEKELSRRTFSREQREILVEELVRQYQGTESHEQVLLSVHSLQDERTFTITTGHQLCLFTGPMYFLFKIISTIRLAEELQQKLPGYRFVPVYWMASEDHDFEEINHTWIQGKKLEWQTKSGGAVGRIPLENIKPLVAELESLLPDSIEKTNWITLIREAYSHKTLAEGTRFLVHRLFGSKGLIVIDPDSPALKQAFVPTMKSELIGHSGDLRVARSTQQLHDLGYKTLVNARAINLFYLQENFRGRIEKNGDGWHVIGLNKSWTQNELELELQTSPENFSPNVVMRPLYQETILPNLAYVGGPGEISYWLQFKSNFDHYQIHFPLLILRDSALILNARQKTKLQKSGLTEQDVFLDRNKQLERILPVSDIAVEGEKSGLKALFDQLRVKAKSIDPTLEGFINAEEQRQLQGLEGVEKKMAKALKQREEVKIQQLDKLMDELMPGGKLNERRDNILPLLNEFGSALLDELFRHFNPLAGKIKVIQPD